MLIYRYDKETIPELYRDYSLTKRNVIKKMIYITSQLNSSAPGFSIASIKRKYYFRHCINTHRQQYLEFDYCSFHQPPLSIWPNNKAMMVTKQSPFVSYIFSGTRRWVACVDKIQQIVIPYKLGSLGVGNWKG